MSWSLNLPSIRGFYWIRRLASISILLAISLNSDAVCRSCYRYCFAIDIGNTLKNDLWANKPIKLAINSWGMMGENLSLVWSFLVDLCRHSYQNSYQKSFL